MKSFTFPKWTTSSGGGDESSDYVYTIKLCLFFIYTITNNGANFSPERLAGKRKVEVKLRNFFSCTHKSFFFILY